MPHSKEIKVLIRNFLRPGKDSRLLCTLLSSHGNAAPSSGSDLWGNRLFYVPSASWSSSQLLIPCGKHLHCPSSSSTIFEWLFFFMFLLQFHLKISFTLKRVMQNICTKALNKTISSNLLGLQQEKWYLKVNSDRMYFNREILHNLRLFWSFVVYIVMFYTSVFF